MEPSPRSLTLVLWLVLGAASTALALGLVAAAGAGHKAEPRASAPTELPAPPASRLNAEAERFVDAWLERKRLNLYGDPPGTVYPGGTPLYDEASGATRDRHEHVLARHPELTDALVPGVEPEVARRIEAWLDAFGRDGIGTKAGQARSDPSPLVDPSTGALIQRHRWLRRRFPESADWPYAVERAHREDAR